MPKKKELSFSQKISLRLFLELSFIASILAAGFVANHSSGIHSRMTFAAFCCFLSFGIAAVFTYIFAWELRIGQFAPWQFYVVKRREHPVLFYFCLSLHVYAILISASIGIYFLWLCFHLP